jgi:hypothetical protein
MWGGGLKKKHTDSFRNHPNLRSSTRTVSSKGTNGRSIALVDDDGRGTTERRNCRILCHPRLAWWAAKKSLRSTEYVGLDVFPFAKRSLPFSLTSSSGVYDTVFQCKNGEIIVLRVDLTRADPQVKLFGCDAQHPLIDSDMHVRIAYHDGKLLGTAVMETILQMQVCPPKILAITNDEVRAMQPSRQTPTYPTNPIILAIPLPVDPPSVSSMTADSAFPRLEPRLSFKDQAQTFVDDDHRQNNHHHHHATNYATTTTPSVISSDHHHVPLAHAVRMMDHASMSDPSSASLCTFEQY